MGFKLNVSMDHCLMVLFSMYSPKKHPNFGAEGFDVSMYLKFWAACFFADLFTKLTDVIIKIQSIIDICSYQWYFAFTIKFETCRASGVSGACRASGDLQSFRSFPAC